jgi:hypothetical protein
MTDAVVLLYLISDVGTLKSLGHVHTVRVVLLAVDQESEKSFSFHRASL